MAEAVAEAGVAVVRGLECVMLGEPSHPVLLSIASRMATVHTPSLSATLPTTLTTLVLHFRTCKEAALPTDNDGVGQ